VAVLCKRCGRQYDVTLFQFGRTVRCDCGEEVGLGAELRADLPEGAARRKNRPLVS